MISRDRYCIRCEDWRWPDHEGDCKVCGGLRLDFDPHAVRETNAILMCDLAQAKAELLRAQTTGA